MTISECPAPRANAGNRANFDAGRERNKAPAGDWEDDAAAVWLAEHFHTPAVLARVLAALAGIGRALG
jgi:hypothetical protein